MNDLATIAQKQYIEILNEYDRSIKLTDSTTKAEASKMIDHLKEKKRQYNQYRYASRRFSPSYSDDYLDTSSLLGMYGGK